MGMESPRTVLVTQTVAVPADSALVSTRVSPTTSTSEAPVPTDPSATFSAGSQSQDAASGTALAVTDMRVAHHDGYDRVVLELQGSGEPGWIMRWQDTAQSAGSGDVVPLEGSKVLVVAVTGIKYPEPGDPSAVYNQRRQPSDTTVVKEVVLESPFEGEMLAFIGATGEVPYRVTSLTNPIRLVIDIQAP